MGNYKLNHSRNLNYYGVAMDNLVERECRKPTSKQIKFYTKLRYLCDEHSIDKKITPEPRSRIAFSMAIDELIKRLNDNGVEIHGNNKSVGILCDMTMSNEVGRLNNMKLIVQDEKEVETNDKS